MNYGPLIFLAAFFALAASWFGFVLTPQMQVGQLQQTNTVPTGPIYPEARPGLARQGLQVYRANGCAYCHSQQLVQSATVCDVVLSEMGTNQAALTSALAKVKPSLRETRLTELTNSLPKPVLTGLTKEEADAAVRTLNASGAKAAVWIVPTGPDIARGWGKRRTVAQDFIFDQTVMLGSQRIGPDLANAGVRLPDPKWHLLHLYAPGFVVKGSTMPPYEYLFDRKRIERVRSPEALILPPGFPPDPGYEIVPKPEAIALAAYLVSLRADGPLFDAPLTVASALPSSSDTNAPAGSGASTNAPATSSGTNTPAAPAK